MSTWHRSKCNKSGPNLGIYYGSLILNVLIIFAVLRVIFINGWNAVARRYNELKIFEQPQRLTSVLQYITRILACEPDRESFPLIAIIFLLVFVLFLIFSLIATTKGGHLDGYSHIWYMLCGVMAAWLFECVHKIVFHPIQIVEKLNTPSFLPWLSDERRCFRFFLKYLMSPLIDADYDWGASSGISESRLESSCVWRFLPDALFVLNGIILSGEGILKNRTISSVFRWVIIQVTSTAFLLVSLLQRGESRLNFSRFLLETPFLNFVGKASFYVYLLQSTAFNFYAMLMVDDIDASTFPFSKDKSYYVRNMWKFEWFKSFPLETKIPGFLCLITLGWILQTYYQDYLVSSFANRIFLKMKKESRIEVTACDNRPYQLL